MAGIGADIWVCGDCRSINNLKAKHCYRCRTPRDLAAVDPAQIEGTGHGKLREIALPEFRSSRWAALLASAMLILLAVMQIVSTVSDAILFGRVLRNPGLLTDPAFARSVESVVAGTVAVAALGVALLALIAWAFWLSRVVMAMPALGLGYPAANGLMAFVENFLPGLNLFRVPAIVRDVMRRLDPGSLRGEALIFAAWIGLLGGYLVPRFGAYLGLFGLGTLEEAVRETLLVQGIATALVVVGATFLVALIWWIERRIVRRRAAQLDGEPPTGSPPVSAAVPVEASVATAPIATYRVEEDPEFVASPEVAADARAPEVAADARAPEVAADAQAPEVAADAAKPMLNRPITAATGAASIPSAPTPPTPEPPPAAEPGFPASPALAPDGRPDVERFADARPASYEPVGAPEPSVEETLAAPEAPSDAAESAFESDAPLTADDQAQAPTDQGTSGPHLHLRVASATSMIATVDGESEPITLDELRAAAEALARSNGSAVIATDGTSFGALSLAEQAFEVLSDARVPTNVED